MIMLIKKNDRSITPLFSAALRLMNVALFLSNGLIFLAQSTFAQGTITVQELHKKLASGEKFILIEVSEPYEYEEFNLGGVLIPLSGFGDEAIMNIKKSYENDEIVILDRKTSARAGMAQNMLPPYGFTNVKVVHGGLLEWEKVYGRNKPVVKPTSETPPSTTPPPQEKTPAPQQKAPN